MRKLEAAWEARTRALRAKHGAPSNLSLAQLGRIKARIRELEDELADD